MMIWNGKSYLVSGFNPCEKYVPVWIIIPNVGKIQHVPNHERDIETHDLVVLHFRNPQIFQGTTPHKKNIKRKSTEP